MANFKGNELYIHDSGLKTGILLTNLGTPDEPTAPSLKTYLRSQAPRLSGAPSSLQHQRPSC